MRRREFINLFGSAAVAWPLLARAQQRERVRRVGVLQTPSESDPQKQTRTEAFEQALRQLGWIIGDNLRIDYRWGAAGDVERIRRYAAELVALGPDVIVVVGTANVAPLLQATRTVPIVFAFVADPVGAGLVESLARPGGQMTGFLQFEYSLSAKWLELLREIAPAVRRAAVLRDPDLSAGLGQFGAIQAVAPSLGLEVVAVNMRDAADIERAVTIFARQPNGGLVVTASALAAAHGELIVVLAARHNLPAVYFLRRLVERGGLISYGPDLLDQFRRTADYVDRILKGEKPADLPVQAPNKYELVINLKTAKTLGLTVPATLLARADEVVE
jgi:ABC-type uncharacterized transport system substrate-binding protein